MSPLTGPLPTAAELAHWIEPLLSTLPRFGGAFLMLPLLKKSFVSRGIRMAFAITMSAVAYPTLAATLPVSTWSSGEWALYALKELFIGGVLGYAMGVLLWALGAVGDLMDLQSGYQNAQIFNPFGGQPGGPFGSLLTQLGVLLFMSLGGLHVFLQLLYESLQIWPAASFTPQLSVAMKDAALQASGSMLETAARLATPVIAVLVIVELAIGLINRVAQQLNTFYFSMPIKAVTALLMLALLLSHLVDEMRGSLHRAPALLDQWDRAWRAP